MTWDAQRRKSAVSRYSWWRTKLTTGDMMSNIVAAKYPGLTLYLAGNGAAGLELSREHRSEIWRPASACRSWPSPRAARHISGTLRVLLGLCRLEVSRLGAPAFRCPAPFINAGFCDPILFRGGLDIVRFGVPKDSFFMPVENRLPRVG